MDKLIITHLEGRLCTALMSGGRLAGLTLEEETPSLLNRIYVGKVQKLVPGINAAFVDLGVTVGYYSLTENKIHLFASGKSSGSLRPGDEILVQVSRDGVKTKAPVLTSNLSLTGRYCVLTAAKAGISFSGKLGAMVDREEIRRLLKPELPEGSGVIIRTNAAFVSPEEVAKEYRSLKAALEKLKEEGRCRTAFSCIDPALPSYVAGIRDSRADRLEQIITDDPDCYEAILKYLKTSQKEDLDKLVFYEDKLLPLPKLYSLETSLERALSRKVWLKSGGYLVIDLTEAMTVIDVNTGKYEGKKKMAETIRRINLEAAEEIGWQLRLRNLSGIIMVDFIDMEREEDKQELLSCLERAVSGDPVKTVVVDMTPLNLVEITRKKVRKPLHEQMGLQEYKRG